MPESTSDSAQIVREQSESVAATNLKSLGDAPAFFQNQSYQETVAHTQGMNQIRTSLVAKAGEMIIHTSPSEGAAGHIMVSLLSKMLNTMPPTVNVPPGGTG